MNTNLLQQKAYDAVSAGCLRERPGSDHFESGVSYVKRRVDDVTAIWPEDRERIVIGQLRWVRAISIAEIGLDGAWRDGLLARNPAAAVKTNRPPNTSVGSGCIPARSDGDISRRDDGSNGRYRQR
jgi:hypothetical protein